MGADGLGDGVGERLDALAASVERLARQNRRHRAVGGSTLLLAAGIVLMGQAPSPQVADEVRARRFVLVDAGGLTRGALTLAPDGSVLLALADAQHRVRVAATVAGDGSSELALHDGRDKRRLTVGVAADAPFLTMTNAEGTAASASLTVSAAGAPVLKLADAAGNPRLVAGVLGPDVSLALTAADSRMSAVLAVDGRAPRLALADSSGTERLWAAIRRESPVLQFFDHNRVARSGLATINDEAGLALMSDSTGPSFPGVVLFGKDQKLLWSAPN